MQFITNISKGNCVDDYVISQSLLIPVKKTVHMTTLFCNHFDISKKYGKVINNGFFVSMGNL
jgi:hypothetical protein